MIVISLEMSDEPEKTKTGYKLKVVYIGTSRLKKNTAYPGAQQPSA